MNEKKRTFEEIIMDSLKELKSEDEKIQFLIEENIVPSLKFSKTDNKEEIKKEILTELKSKTSLKNKTVNDLILSKKMDQSINITSLTLLLKQIKNKKSQKLYNEPIASVNGLINLILDGTYVFNMFTSTLSIGRSDEHSEIIIGF
jgi:hypothetical protein